MNAAVTDETSAMTTRKPHPRRKSKSGGGSAMARRAAARLAAVQALYQIELAGASVEAVIGEFIEHRLGHEVDGDTYVAGDPVLFAAIVRGTRARHGDVSDILDKALEARGPVTRMELLLRTILFAGAFELLSHADVPSRILVSAYVDIAHAFYGGREPGLVNGVLDRLAKIIRPDDFTTLPPAPSSLAPAP